MTKYEREHDSKRQSKQKEHIAESKRTMCENVHIVQRYEPSQAKPNHTLSILLFSLLCTVVRWNSVILSSLSLEPHLKIQK